MPPSPPSSAAPSLYDCFAVAAPGLEPLVAAELRDLGESPTVVEGGVEWQGDAESLCRANLWLRTASRVVVRAANFRARTFYELERHARRIAWERYLTPGSAVRFHVTCRKSRLYHSDAVAQRIAESIEHRLGASSVFAAHEPGPDDDDGDAAREQLILVRMAHDVCTVSVDSSGALLHRRGYRQAVARAPLRETLAAALLGVAGWRGEVPLVDPFCGSGTIPIEAALVARRIPPGLHRQFACLDWPGFPRAAFAGLLERARGGILAGSPVRIAGSDRDAGAIEAARANAERAGVAGDVEFVVCAVSDMPVPAGDSGLVACNPPYGVRVGDRHEVRNLYAQFGNILRRRAAGWRVAMYSPDAKLSAQLRLALEPALRTRNGGIPVQAEVGTVPSAQASAPARIYF
ncbi:MAG TPA: THUMP domain-containing protein [Gemmatimonadaceae bacterium]|nr:THUMP domain-containing protein [Gemmatimonadaceae bacterium]